MTKDEFLKEYHNYATLNRDDAVATIMDIDIDNDKAVVVNLGNLGYCIMLESVAELLGVK